MEEKESLAKSEDFKYKTFVDEDDEDASGPGEKFTIQEAVEKIGYGKFQVIITLASGFAWIGDGMEIMILSILGPELECEWEISSTESALITTVVFAGYLIGSPVFGYLGDMHGRRKALMISSAGLFVSGVSVSFSPTYGVLLVLRFCVGFFVGGCPQAVTYCSEFLPNETRGRTLILVEIFWALGGMIEVLLGLAVLEPFGWRYWIAVSAIPALIYVIFCLYLPESPQYDLTCGNYEKAYATMEKIARTNKKPMPHGKLVQEAQVERGNWKDMFVPELKKTSYILGFLWFASCFCYYGAVLITTELIQDESTCPPSNLTDEDGCDELETEDYLELLWTTSAEMPALLLTCLIIDTIGRKPTYYIENVIFSATCFFLFICMEKAPMLILLFIGRGMVVSAFQVLFVYTPEVYPTNIRGLSLGMGSAMGRFGAIITPYIAQVVYDESIRGSLSVYGCFSLIAAGLSYFLPFETKGRSLAQVTSSQKVTEPNI